MSDLRDPGDAIVAVRGFYPAVLRFVGAQDFLCMRIVTRPIRLRQQSVSRPSATTTTYQRTHAINIDSAFARRRSNHTFCYPQEGILLAVRCHECSFVSCKTLDKETRGV